MSEAPKKKVLWLTNLPAPYRFPIWDRMSESVDLTVVFLLKPKNWRNWPAPENKNWDHKFLSFHSLQIREFDFIPSFRNAKELLKNIDIAIIGGWEAPLYIRTILLAKIKGIPIIQFYESFQESHRFKSGPIAWVRKLIFSKPDKFLTISKKSELSLIKMGVPKNQIITLFNPIDVSWFHTFAQGHRRFQTQGHRYIYVGQLIERKNVATVIQAFAEIKNDFDTMTIVGDGPLAHELKTIAISLGMKDSINFVGHKNQEELAVLYAESNTLILASTNEVWGLVVNEGLASGLHVVVSHKCGVAEFVKGMKGVYICFTDQRSIKEAMKASSNAWTGYNQRPEILRFTPERFADELLNVLA